MKQNAASRRINKRAQAALANILLFDVSDPDLEMVTVTACEVAIDKSVMRVYVSCDKNSYEKALLALNRAKGRIRKLLGSALRWRVTPELIFAIDNSCDEAEKIAQALQNVPPTLRDENA